MPAQKKASSKRKPDRRIRDSRSSNSGPLLGKDDLPLVVTERHQRTVVVEIEEFVARAGGVTGESVHNVVTVEERTSRLLWQ